MDVKNLEGIVVPMVTPLNMDETVNYPALKKLVNYIINGGVHALFPMGTTGEFARLSLEDRFKVLEVTVSETQNRIPVVAGISDTGLNHVLKNLTIAEQVGADAVAVTPPYYYPTYSEDEIIAFYNAVATHSSLPVILYNIPVTCGSSISLTALEQIFSQNPNVIGLKDSSGNLNYILEVISKFHHNPGIRIFIGDESLGFQGLSAGAHGLVPSLANAFPRIFVALYQAIKVGDTQKAETITAQINEMNQLNSYSESWMSAITWRKVALAQMGICSETMTQPYIPVTDSVRKDISKLVQLYSKNYGINY